MYRTHGPAVDTIELVECDDPSPGANEVVVQVEAAPLHFGDLLYVEGRLANAPAPPAVAGSEGVGRIVACGSQVSDLRIGQRVFLPRKSGTFAQRMCVPAASVVAAPEHGDALQLALVPVNALTSYLLLTRVATLAAGDWLLQNGANSSCGRFIIGIARRLGLRTVNVVRRPELVDELLQWGADAVLLDGADLAARVASATNSAPILFAIDAVAGDATARLASCLAQDGVVAVYGFMSQQACRVPADLLFLNNLRIQGYFMPHFERGMARGEQLTVLRDLGQWVANGELRAKIAATYALRDVRAAFRHELRTGAARDGKIILLPNG